MAFSSEGSLSALPLRPLGGQFAEVRSQVNSRFAADSLHCLLFRRVFDGAFRNGHGTIATRRAVLSGSWFGRTVLTRFAEIPLPGDLNLVAGFKCNVVENVDPPRTHERYTRTTPTRTPRSSLELRLRESKKPS
jgi:hypothetical protein